MTMPERLHLEPPRKGQLVPRPESNRKTVTYIRADLVAALIEALTTIQYEDAKSGGGKWCRCCGRWLDEGCNQVCRVSLALAAVDR